MNKIPRLIKELSNPETLIKYSEDPKYLVDMIIQCNKDDTNFKNEK